MGDIGDYWREHREHRKRVNPERTDEALRNIEKLSLMQGVEVTHHTEWHVTFFYRGRAADLYPSTGKWLGRKPKRSGYGIQAAASFLGINWKEVECCAELVAEQVGNIESEGTDGER